MDGLCESNDTNRFDLKNYLDEIEEIFGIEWPLPEGLYTVLYENQESENHPPTDLLSDKTSGKKSSTGEFSKKIIEVARPVVIEAERLYNLSIKEFGVKEFSAIGLDEKKKVVIETFKNDENHKEFKHIKEKDLYDSDLYSQFSLDKEKSQFVFRLLKSKMKKLGYGRMNYQKLTKAANPPSS